MPINASRLRRRQPTSLRALALGLAAAFVLASCESATGPGVVPPPVTDPPRITCPAAQTVQSPTGNATAVTYGPATVVNGKSPVTTICTPSAGSEFPVGQTTVMCTATDTLQRADTCTFPVTVLPPPRLAATSFVAFGDSITRGEDGRNSPSETSLTARFYPRVLLPDVQTYPGVLQQNLAYRYRTQLPIVANRGYPGEAITDPYTFSRFVGLTSSHQYDVVLIMEGSNDLLLSTRDSSVLPRAVAGLRDMVRDAKTRFIRPYLATIPPINPAGSRGRFWGADLVPGFNDSIRSVAAFEGVTLVDVYQGFGGNFALLGSDGLHPTAEGYAKIGDLFFTAIKQTLETPLPSSTGTTGASRPTAPRIR